MDSDKRRRAEENSSEESVDEWGAQLQQLLYRAECPAPDLLQEYYWQHLQGTVRQQIHDHLQRCPLCQQEVAAIQAFVEQDVVRPRQESAFPTLATHFAEGIEQLSNSATAWLTNLAQQGQWLVARYVDSLTPVESGILALRAGEQDNRQLLTYEIEGGEVSLIVQRNAAQRLLVNGQLLSDELENGAGRFHLSAQDPDWTPVTGAIDEFGSFTVDDLWPGHYQLLLSGEEYTILVPDIELR